MGEADGPHTRMTVAAVMALTAAVLVILHLLFALYCLLQDHSECLASHCCSKFPTSAEGDCRNQQSSSRSSKQLVGRRGPRGAKRQSNHL